MTRGPNFLSFDDAESFEFPCHPVTIALIAGNFPAGGGREKEGAGGRRKGQVGGGRGRGGGVDGGGEGRGRRGAAPTPPAAVRLVGRAERLHTAAIEVHLADN